MERYVLPTIAGEKHECYAITEENAGSDVSDLASRPPVGTATTTSSTASSGTSRRPILSDYLFFQGKLIDGPKAGQHALFIVDMDTPGSPCTCGRRPTPTPMPITTGRWDSRTCGCRPSHLVGEEGDGMAFAHEWFRFERMMIAARCCGAADRLIEEVTSFAEQRIIGGEKLADYQAIQFMLADSLTELWGARLMVYEIAREIDAGADVKMIHAHSSMAKLTASEMAYRVADRAVQIFGGRGYMRENVAERFLRELRVDRIWEGASEIQRVIIADQLRKRGVGITR